MLTSIYNNLFDDGFPPDDEELLSMGFIAGDVVCGMFNMDELGQVIYDGWFVLQPGMELPYDARELRTIGW
jgi:hypothetical protein